MSRPFDEKWYLKGFLFVIISRVSIKQFRGFSDVKFDLADHITLIAGQNGTQKSTLLGIISQPFTITDKTNPLYKEKPLSGGSYKSSFQEKFRLSPFFDKAKEHEWTIELHESKDGFTLQSIYRDKSSGTLRFWRKGDRSRGTGYIQKPVIFLSLKRLIPTAEEESIEVHEDITLSQHESEWFATWYTKIMISNDNVQKLDALKSANKNTLGVTTDYYDWNSNSAGQDNLAKILLSVLSFKRLKECYPSVYEGGILAIDEIDATLYPGSQIKLLNALSNFCSKYKIQVVATTHSLQLLKEADSLRKQRGRKKQFHTVYLRRQDTRIILDENPAFERILHNLNLSLDKTPQLKKIDIYTEDKETIHFTKALLKRNFSSLNFVDCSLGCQEFIGLARRKVPSFTYPNSIVVLDGDTKDSLKNKRLKNFLCLPGLKSPESMLAMYLNGLADDSRFWTEKNQDYSKQHCFQTYNLHEILGCRIKAKSWYNEQLASDVWGREGGLAFKYLLTSIEEEVTDFIRKFKALYDELII